MILNSNIPRCYHWIYYLDIHESEASGFMCFILPKTQTEFYFKPFGKKDHQNRIKIVETSKYWDFIEKTELWPEYGIKGSIDDDFDSIYCISCKTCIKLTCIITLDQLFELFSILVFSCRSQSHTSAAFQDGCQNARWPPIWKKCRLDM